MTPELELKTLAHAQAVVFHFVAWRGALASFIAFVRYSIGPDSPTPDEIDVFLRRKETQDLLASKYDVALWRAADKSYRAVSLTPAIDTEVAKRRLAHRPTNPGSQCRFCEIDEKGFANLELRSELDIHGHPVLASLLHPQCMRSWLLMRALVGREGS